MAAPMIADVPLALALAAAFFCGFAAGAPVWTYLALRRAAREYDARMRLASRYRTEDRE